MRFFFHLMSLCLFCVACAGQKTHKGTQRTFILVHGAFQDETSWSKVADELRGQGHIVHTPRLPNRGCPADQISPKLLQYATTVGDIAHASKTPVTLVGQDFSGIVVSRVAELLPKKVEAIVYVGAYVPKSGDSFRSLAMSDTESVLAARGNFVMSPDYRCASLGDAAKGMAYPGLSPEKLLSEPMSAMGESPEITGERFGNVPKYFVTITDDKLVGPKLQDKMASGTPMKKQEKIDGGHSVTMTKAKELAETIQRVLTP